MRKREKENSGFDPAPLPWYWKRVLLVFLLVLAAAATVLGLVLVRPWTQGGRNKAGLIATTTTVHPEAVVAQTTPTVVVLMKTATPEAAVAVPQTVVCSVQVRLDEEDPYWSNASALLLVEGWCALVERDQAWQQVRDEEALRKTWKEGATEDYLLLCNPGPGSRLFNLQDSFGGRPPDWWNDQAKAVLLFRLPGVTTSDDLVIAVLYEHDDDQLEEGWEFPILLPHQN